MDVLVLKNGKEIEIENGGSLSSLFTTVKSFADLETLANELEKQGNLENVRIESEKLASAKYENLTLDTTFETVDMVSGGIRVEISLRPMTSEELQQKDVQTVLTYLTDEQAATVPNLYPEWSAAGQYMAGDRCLYNEILYKCLQTHTAQSDWTPETAPSLWVKILAGQEGTGIGEWEQPESTNPYQKGEKVVHNGKTWESLIDNNVWEPGAVGSETLWKEVDE